jgi:hypothetical protein
MTVQFNTTGQLSRRSTATCKCNLYDSTTPGWIPLKTCLGGDQLKMRKKREDKLLNTLQALSELQRQHDELHFCVEMQRARKEVRVCQACVCCCCCLHQAKGMTTVVLAPVL